MNRLVYAPDQLSLDMTDWQIFLYNADGTGFVILSADQRNQGVIPAKSPRIYSVAGKRNASGFVSILEWRESGKRRFIKRVFCKFGFLAKRE